METANSVITDALQLIVKQASEAPIEADDARIAIRFLNRQMARFASKGLDLGYTQVSNLGDNITIPDGALDGVIGALALALAPLYQAPVTLELKQYAQDGLKTIYQICNEFDNVSMPSTLPVGSGNACTLNNTFYPLDAESLDSEVNEPIVVEDSTEA